MTQRAEELKAALRTGGHRLTPQRMAICEVLAASGEHPTPYVVHQEVRQRFPTVSLATVYNTLNALRDMGEIVAIGLGRDKTHYEPNMDPHANLICLECGRILDFEDIPVDYLREVLESRSGFAVKNTRIDVFGICQDCQEKAKQHE